jgi:thiamine pyrophosphate-dependent acetolactate synthase large subunit-like protein
MKVGEAIAEILKREGVEYLFGYPQHSLFDFAAAIGIRPIIVRQERTGLHMADAVSRMSSGNSIGVFAMQFGPGVENSYGAIAQAFGESVPVLVLPTGYRRRNVQVKPNYNPVTSMQTITKSAESILVAAEIPNIMRRAFTRLRNGRGGPVLVEIPIDMWAEEVPDPLSYQPVVGTRTGPDPLDVSRAASLLSNAKRPVIYAGQGVHYSKAWPALRRLAELLAVPVVTSLAGKSAFPEDHPLSLGAGGWAISKQVHHFLQAADVIFGIGCSFTETPYGAAIPKGPKIIHSTLDPDHLNNGPAVDIALLGDARLVFEAILSELDEKARKPRDPSMVAAEIRDVRATWMADWLPMLTSAETPINPYRVLWDLQHTVNIKETIITHDAGSPRDQLSPFWKATSPLGYIGWGKTTQLGYGLGLAMGAKIANPGKLCINVWGDAAIGFTGMDLETAVRERIPILSILLNNFSMAIELNSMRISTEKYRSTDVSGDYAAMARAFGAYGERVTDPAQIIPAIKRGIEQTLAGRPALLEFITAKETRRSRF